MLPTLLVAEVIFAITSAVKDVCGKPPTERLFLDKYGRICLCLDEIVWKVDLQLTFLASSIFLCAYNLDINIMLSMSTDDIIMLYCGSSSSLFLRLKLFMQSFHVNNVPMSDMFCFSYYLFDEAKCQYWCCATMLCPMITKLFYTTKTANKFMLY